MVRLGLLILLFILSHPSFGVDNQRGFVGVSNMSDPLDEKIINSRQQAIEIINLAISRSELERPDDPILGIYTSLVNILRTTPITKRDPHDSLKTSCESLELDLYVPTKPFKKVFRVCKGAFDFSQNELAQSFIHEAMHIFENETRVPYLLDDVRREVISTKYEHLIMISALGCVYFNNGYFNQEKYRPLMNELGVRPAPLCN